jgi:hypothetical protein
MAQQEGIMNLLHRLGYWVDHMVDVIASTTCKHKWRPARTTFAPARYCDHCELVETISPETFYALFGRWWQQ